MTARNMIMDHLEGRQPLPPDLQNAFILAYGLGHSDGAGETRTLKEAAQMATGIAKAYLRLAELERGLQELQSDEPEDLSGSSDKDLSRIIQDRDESQERRNAAGDVLLARHGAHGIRKALLEGGDR
jgi:hypothetical protein